MMYSVQNTRIKFKQYFIRQIMLSVPSAPSTKHSLFSLLLTGQILWRDRTNVIKTGRSREPSKTKNIYSHHESALTLGVDQQMKILNSIRPFENDNDVLQY